MKRKIIFTILIIVLGFVLNSFYYKTLSPSISDDLALSTVNEKDSTNRMVLRQSHDVNNTFSLITGIASVFILWYIWREEITLGFKKILKK